MNAPYGMSTVGIVGWTLIHSIWQVAIIWGLNRVAQAAFRDFHSSIRYTLASIAMMIACAVTSVTAATCYWGSSEHSPTLLPSGLVAMFDVQIISPGWANALLWANSLLPPIVIIWAAWLALRLLSVVSAWFNLRRHLESSRSSCPSQDQFLRLRSVLVPSLEIRFVESSAITVPATFGWWRPVILLPVGLATEMAPAMVEAIIAHELAHIRRRDFLINLVQSLLEAVLWFHPLVWSLSAEIRELREECCDELAIEALGKKRRTYSEALRELDVIRLPEPLLLGASGGTLVRRIERIVSNANNGHRMVKASRLVALCVLVIASLGFVGRTVTSSVGSDLGSVVLAIEPTPVAIYRILSATNENPDFAPAIE
ncbi:MAG: peptidase BlaR1, partial [Phycisphaerales bacterium]|nr:peptidase BlaR1 [Phycisphaerales bacterium]